jgi:hypothetical protein
MTNEDVTLIFPGHSEADRIDPSEIRSAVMTMNFTGRAGLTGCSFFSPFPEEREKENPPAAEGSYGLGVRFPFSFSSPFF